MTTSSTTKPTLTRTAKRARKAQASRRGKRLFYFYIDMGFAKRADLLEEKGVGIDEAEPYLLPTPLPRFVIRVNNRRMMTDHKAALAILKSEGGEMSTYDLDATGLRYVRHLHEVTYEVRQVAVRVERCKDILPGVRVGDIVWLVTGDGKRTLVADSEAVTKLALRHKSFGMSNALVTS